MDGRESSRHWPPGINWWRISEGRNMNLSVLATFLGSQTSAAARTAAVKTALQTPAGRMLRDELGSWVIQLLPAEALVPEIYAKLGHPASAGGGAGAGDLCGVASAGAGRGAVHDLAPVRGAAGSQAGGTDRAAAGDDARGALAALDREGSRAAENRPSVGAQPAPRSVVALRVVGTGEWHPRRERGGDRRADRQATGAAPGNPRGGNRTGHARRGHRQRGGAVYMAESGERRAGAGRVQGAEAVCCRVLCGRPGTAAATGAFPGGQASRIRARAAGNHHGSAASAGARGGLWARAGDLGGGGADLQGDARGARAAADQAALNGHRHGAQRGRGGESHGGAGGRIRQAAAARGRTVDRSADRRAPVCARRAERLSRRSARGQSAV